MMQILQKGEKMHSLIAPPTGFRRIVGATPSAAGPRCRDEGCGVVAVLC